MPRKKSVPEQEDSMELSPQEQEWEAEQADVEAVESAVDFEGTVDAEPGEDLSPTEDTLSSHEEGSGELPVTPEGDTDWPESGELPSYSETPNDSTVDAYANALPEEEFRMYYAMA